MHITINQIILKFKGKKYKSKAFCTFLKNEFDQAIFVLKILFVINSQSKFLFCISYTSLYSFFYNIFFKLVKTKIKESLEKYDIKIITV